VDNIGGKDWSSNGNSWGRKDDSIAHFGFGLSLVGFGEDLLIFCI